MQNINWLEVLIAMVVGVAIWQFSTRLTKWFRKEGMIREPIGKYGWGFVKGDFKARYGRLILICAVLAIIFYIIYKVVV